MDNSHLFIGHVNYNRVMSIKYPGSLAALSCELANVESLEKLLFSVLYNI